MVFGVVRLGQAFDECRSVTSGLRALGDRAVDSRARFVDQLPPAGRASSGVRMRGALAIDDFVDDRAVALRDCQRLGDADPMRSSAAIASAQTVGSVVRTTAWLAVKSICGPAPGNATSPTRSAGVSRAMNATAASIACRPRPAPMLP